MAVLMLGIVLAFGLCFFTALLKWKDVRNRNKHLPPGTMGWPIFGESIKFLRQGPNFMLNKRARYGSLFKLHIFGRPTVACMDPDFSKYILMNEGKGFIPGYPQSMIEILGKWNILGAHGSQHKIIRGAMLSMINPNMIKDHLISKIDEFMRSHVSNWNDKVIDIHEKTKEMALMSPLKQLISIAAGPRAEALRMEFYKMILGTLSLPIKLPGTNYYRAFQAREKILIILREVMAERRVSQNTNKDLLDFLLKNGDEKSENQNISRLQLADEQILDLIISIVYSGYENVYSTSMMAVKYLHDHPKVLEELREEHFAIREGKEAGESINWSDFKSMNFTRCVIFEVLRMSKVVNGALRKTAHDLEMNGYVVPKGWMVYIYTREINYDPFIYPEPLTFNPWRWKDKRLESHQHFLIFGAGGRLCPGKDVGVVQIAMFIHYFVTRYRWEEIKGDKLIKSQTFEALNGLHIRVSNY